MGNSQAQLAMMRRPDINERGSFEKTNGSIGALTCTISSAEEGGVGFGEGETRSVVPGNVPLMSMGQQGMWSRSKAACIRRAPSPSPVERESSPHTAIPSLVVGGYASGRGASVAGMCTIAIRRTEAGNNRKMRWATGSLLNGDILMLHWPWLRCVTMTVCMAAHLTPDFPDGRQYSCTNRHCCTNRPNLP
jgi:hypothetical protein